jgi:hypothetical protein
MASLNGYKESSAKVVLGAIRRLGLVDVDGKPTPLLQKWRCDEEYPEACAQMLRAGFPPEIIEAAEGAAVSTEQLCRLFMAAGLGEKTAYNVTRLFLILKSARTGPGQRRLGSATAVPRRDPTATRLRSASKGRVGQAGRRPGRTAHDPGSYPNDADRNAGRRVLADAGTNPPSEVVWTVPLDRGRTATLRFPDDITAREWSKLVALLQVQERFAKDVE